jgi:predicted DNA-binding ribbon-helix-helix protein
MATKPFLPLNKYRGHRTNIRWTPYEFKKLSNMAKAEKLYLSEFIRKCVKEYNHNFFKQINI